MHQLCMKKASQAARGSGSPGCIKGRTIDASIFCGNLSWGSSFKLELLICPTGARSSGGTLPKKLVRARWTCLGERSF